MELERTLHGAQPTLPCPEYTRAELAALIENAPKLSQEGNDNANADLFLLGDTVLKLFFQSAPRTRDNICNLLAMRRTPALFHIDGLALPKELIRCEGRIVGYRMPYISGVTLYRYLTDRTSPFQQKLGVFKQLADVINRLPQGVYIGDLHAGNVMVDAARKAYVIDTDGFSFRDGAMIPIALPLPEIPGKYRTPEGEPIVSRNSDIFCLLHIFLSFLSNGTDVLLCGYGEEYLRYLRGTTVPKALADALEAALSPSENAIPADAFDLNARHLEELRYDTFLNTTGRIKDERNAMRLLKRL